MNFFSFHWVAFLAALILLPACAGLPVRGSVGGRDIETRVDSEVARYYLANYLANKRIDARLDERIDRVYRNGNHRLPDRGELKRLSEEFSVDFAAVYFADQIARLPGNRDFRAAYNQAYEHALKSLTEFSDLAGKYEIVFVPGYLYKRHPITGADLAAPRAALTRAGFTPHFIETVEDGAIEANAEIVAAAIRARSQSGRRLILVSVSKSGAEVAAALTRLGPGGAGSVAAWVNVVGTLQGSPLADESLQQWEDWVGKVDAAGVESLSTSRSRRRFDGFRIPQSVFVVNYIGIPFTGSVSRLASSGFLQLRAHGPNDGLSLLSDLIVPGAVTLTEVGRDHFLLDDQVDTATIALAWTVIRQVEQGGRGARLDVNGP